MAKPTQYDFHRVLRMFSYFYLWEDAEKDVKEKDVISWQPLFFGKSDLFPKISNFAVLDYPCKLTK